MQKIVTVLTFNNQAEEAAQFYASAIKNSRVVNISRYGEGGPVPQGSVLAVTFELDGQEFVAINGGPSFKFSEGMSILIKCGSQSEVDDLWQSCPLAEVKAPADG